MTAAQQPATPTVSMSKNAELNKPLYTVPPTFTPLNVPQQQPGKTETKQKQINLNTGEIDEVVKQMIVIQIEAFETEIRQIRQQSKQLMENVRSLQFNGI